MTLEQTCWLATAAYGAHIVEETALGWCTWAQRVSGLTIRREVFFVVNAFVVLLGIVAANLASAWPTLALTYFALMLINTLVHLGAFLRMRSVFSPGLFSALGLFVPVGIYGYRNAAELGLLTEEHLAASILFGLMLMTAPVLLFRASTVTWFNAGSQNPPTKASSAKMEK